MGAVHKEVPSQNLGYHEYESVTLSDPKCVESLIKFKNRIYSEDQAEHHFSELMSCIYIDLDNAIKQAPLSRSERWVVELLLKGYTLSDIADEFNIPYITVYKTLVRACRKIAKYSSGRSEAVLKKRLNIDSNTPQNGQ